ncbi:putative adenylate kinase [Bacillus phage BSP36]|uniref:Putative adenylate kinase n=1 Tax=Bacillus phage BSP38 TaxID=2283013 RepID=A0A345MJP9_BPBSP|nr:putative adenylate kinase [Bacillus phage BSP38]AXH71081.1 putative adenylate kinase [Bacillus phage BSP38]AYJ75125.1 putative adenylate kinase [Bacillus phage BSP36]
MRATPIAICGETRTGKSTAAKYLIDRLKMVPFSFGDELKKGFHKEYPHILTNPKPVKGYRLYGELKRYVEGNDVWIKKCFDLINRYEEVAENYSWHGIIPEEERVFRPIIDDLRQEDEFIACQENGFFTIRIESSKEVRRQRMIEEGDEFTEEDLEFGPESHVNEFPVDFVVVNDGTLEELYDQLDCIVRVLTSPTH